ncbi:MAG: TIM-barrel domain-containing protein, partial [Terrimicrobiaceae bacterium]
SGFTGSNRYTAIWTGDNYSNYLHFRNSIPTTLNLTFTAPAEIRQVTINGQKAKPCSAQGVPIGNRRMKTWSLPGASPNRVAAPCID